MIRASIMDDVIAAVWQRVVDALTVFGDYAFIGEIWVAVVVLALGGAYVALFVPWQWLRGVLGFVVSIAIAVAVGATIMFKRMRGETKAVRERARAAEKKKADDERHGSWF